MVLSTGNKINRLLLQGQYRGLFFSEHLCQLGYTHTQLKSYRDSGWLTSLAHGVMYRTGDKLSALAALSSFNQQLSQHYRVGAHSALELRGFNHYVPMGKASMMVVADTCRPPKWFGKDVFDYKFELFTANAFTDVVAEKIKVGETEVLVSSPELAFMECLSIAPQRYAYIDLYYIMEQLTTLRSDVVQHLLESCSTYRMKRMFLYMAEKAGHYWFDMLDLSKVDLGTSKLQLVKDGVYNAKYRITIPKELNSYE